MNYKFCAQIFQIVIVIVIVIAFMVRWEVLGIWKAYPLSGTATHILSWKNSGKILSCKKIFCRQSLVGGLIVIKASKSFLVGGLIVIN